MQSSTCPSDLPNPNPASQTGQVGPSTTLLGMLALVLPLGFALGFSWYRKRRAYQRTVLLLQQIAMLESQWRSHS
ncbi:hypothetical protein ACKFKG_12235 [Phormidesmis sp. 146-35]